MSHAVGELAGERDWSRTVQGRIVCYSAVGVDVSWMVGNHVDVIIVSGKTTGTINSSRS